MSKDVAADGRCAQEADAARRLVERAIKTRLLPFLASHGTGGERQELVFMKQAANASLRPVRHCSHTVLTALARQELAIKRVVVFAEEHALAPGAPRSRDVMEGPRTTNQAMRAILILGPYAVKILALIGG